MMLKALSQQSTMRSAEGCEEWERLTYDPVRATADWPPATLHFTDVCGRKKNWPASNRALAAVTVASHNVLASYVGSNT